ncbi:MAG: hypothetical protein RLZZ416_13 [Candidatus Parcubacteria bacterium]|jgi:hypothetical protein
MHSRRKGNRGVTLLDTVVGTALMLVIFLGIAAAFQLALDVVINNKARSGAIALANERMEYIRSLTYASVGTSGGIPSGSIPQSEIVTLNGTTFTRRTTIEYGDDPKDGTGGADTNGIISDYKSARVDVAWTSRTGTRHITLVSRLETPSGMETSCTPPCGNLVINAVNAASQALSGASVSIVNASTSPAINLDTFTNASGTAYLIGAPAAAGYRITVTKSGYSTAQTYGVTSQNTNPNPGNLTVSNAQTTTGTFAIDLLGAKTVQTWTQILPATWADSFADESKIATSSNAAVAGGSVFLADNSFSGEVQSVAIAPAYIYRWKSLSWNDTRPVGSSIAYRVYDAYASALIPDSQLPGNSAGFTASPISLLGVSTSTYAGLRIDAVLSPGSAAPSIESWNIDYDYGPQPLQNVSFTLQGGKAIGSGPSGTIYKYSALQNSGASASVTIPNLEWDTYTITLDGASAGYDIASSCPAPQPEALSPGATLSTSLYLAPHTDNSLLVDVRSLATGALIPGATVNLSRGVLYSATSTADSCGQTFFSSLAQSSAYSLTVSAPGFVTYSNPAVDVNGTIKFSVQL